MSTDKQLQSQASHDERTRAGKHFTPATDIFESKDALLLVMDLPGVDKDNVDIRLENDLLEVEGRIAAGLRGIAGYDPVYSEYNVGHYYRRFALSNKIAKDRIEAKIEDGVLTLTLPKAPEFTPRKIAVN